MSFGPSCGCRIRSSSGVSRGVSVFSVNELAVGDDVLAALDLLDLLGAGEQRIEVAVFRQELGSGLGADAGNARDVVGAVAGQRLQIDHLFRRHAPFLDDFGNGDLLVLHAVIHRDALRHELHEVLVGGDDGDVGAVGFRKPRIGGDQVVRLEAFLLDAGQVEGARGMADQAELRDQVFRRRGAVRLVLIVKLVAEGLRGIVEDDGEMRRRHAHVGVARILQQLPQHVAETRDGIDRQPVRLAGQWRQGMEGTEDETRAVDEEEMITFFHGVNG